jgi:hypothetical protein
MIYQRKSKMEKTYLTSPAQRRASDRYRNSDVNREAIKEYDRVYKTYMYHMSEDFREMKKQQAREYYYKQKAKKEQVLKAQNQ